MRVSNLRLVLVLLATPGIAAAQAGAYIAIDDPATPLARWLIARGDVLDPSPQVRPWRRDELIAALRRADTDSTTSSGRVIHQLLRLWAPVRPPPSWIAEGRAGAESYSSGRRDLLHPAGGSGLSPYVMVGAWLDAGPFAAGSRVIAENRLNRDPDWTGDAAQRSEQLPLRAAEGWVTASWKSLQIHYGQVDRNWGPDGLAGLALANVEAYARPDLGITFQRGRIDASLVVQSLDDAYATTTPAVVRSRAFMAHRVGFRLSSTLHLAAWETMVVGGPVDAWGRASLAGLYPDLIAHAAGASDADRQVIAGLDASVRPARQLGVEVQLAVQRGSQGDSANAPQPLATAFAGTAFGPLGSYANWRVSYSRIGSQMYSAAPVNSGSLLSFTNLGPGIVRTIAGYDRIAASVALPIGMQFVVEPGIALQRQSGDRPGGIVSGSTAAPSSVVERVREGSVAVDGQRGHLRLDAVFALQQVTNAGNATGSNVVRVEGRIIATIGLRLNGSAQ